MRATLHICTTCRGAPPAPPDAPGLRVIPTPCLNACARGPAAALTGADGWTHITGALDAASGPALAAWAAGGAAPGRLIASIPPEYQEFAPA